MMFTLFSDIVSDNIDLTRINRKFAIPIILIEISNYDFCIFKLLYQKKMDCRVQTIDKDILQAEIFNHYFFSTFTPLNITSFSLTFNSFPLEVVTFLSVTSLVRYKETSAHNYHSSFLN